MQLKNLSVARQTLNTLVLTSNAKVEVMIVVYPLHLDNLLLWFAIVNKTIYYWIIFQVFKGYKKIT